MKTVLITGGCGFIGHHMVEHFYINTNFNIVVIDMLSYASHGLSKLKDAGMFESQRVRIFTYNLCQSIPIGMVNEIGQVEYIIHMAAETHVDNSISDPVYCIKNNVMSTTHILEFARSLNTLEKFFYFSTDEVYGPAIDKSFTENDRHTPTNPYSASKSAGEGLCVAYSNTYATPVITVNVMNAFGERQHVEKFIPKCIKSILTGEKLFIHSYPDCSRPGTRFYIHARNISSAILFLINKGVVGERYNIEGEQEVSNLEIATKIADIMGRDLKYEMIDFHSSRPGHDLRYSLDGTKLRTLGWCPGNSFEESLRKTVEWTVKNTKWLE